MKKTIIVAVLATALAIPQPAAALPRTAEAFEAQVNLCKAGLEMIVDGATDDEELEFYNEELVKYGWDEERDLEDLLLLCVFFKQGYLYGRALRNPRISTALATLFLLEGHAYATRTPTSLQAAFNVSAAFAQSRST
jgi:hypothetical protein